MTKRQLAKLLSEFDLMHIHDPWLANTADSREWLEIHLAASAKIPYVIGLHNFIKLPPIPAQVICVSKAVARLQKNMVHCYVVPNGVDPKRFNYRPPRPAARIRLIRVCRPARCDSYFWRAIDRLLKRNRHVEAWIVGEQGVSTEGLKFFGGSSDVSHFLRRGHIFTYIPRPQEGAQDLAVLEAMAMGVPPVLTDVHSVNESVTHMHDGILVPYGNVSKYVDAVQQLIEDQDLRWRLGMNARQTVLDKFTIQRVVCEYEKIYERLVSENSTHGNSSLPSIPGPKQLRSRR